MLAPLATPQKRPRDDQTDLWGRFSFLGHGSGRWSAQKDTSVVPISTGFGVWHTHRISLSLVAQGGTLSVPPRGPKTSFRVLTRVAKPRSCSENYHDMHTLQTSSAGLWPWRARKSVIKLLTFGGQSGSRCALESARAASFGAQNYCCCCHMLSNWAATCRGTPGWRTYQRGTPRTCRYFLANKNTRQWRKIELPKSLIIRLTLVVILLSEEAANSRRERKWPLTDRCVTLTVFCEGIWRLWAILLQSCGEMLARKDQVQRRCRALEIINFKA